MSRGTPKESDTPALPAGDYVFLSFLTVAPMTAYDIKKAMAESVSNFWSTAHSQVYQQATRLIRDGYVRQTEVAGPRRKRELFLTDKGREAVGEWLRAPAKPTQVFSELLVKVFFADQAGDLDATRRILEDQRQQTLAILESYEDLMHSLRLEPAVHYPAQTLEFGIRFARMSVGWIDEQIAAIDAQPKPSRRKPRRKAP
jgi:DNA-binding PadR family transcriptional regulator